MGVTLTGHIDVPPERLEAVAAALPEHIRLTTAEPGCVRFEVRADPATQGRFLVTEEFTDRAAFEAHQTRTATSPWAEITRGLPRDYSVEET